MASKPRGARSRRNRKIAEDLPYDPAEWERRLAKARAQREKVLAERAAKSGDGSASANRRTRRPEPASKSAPTAPDAPKEAAVASAAEEPAEAGETAAAPGLLQRLRGRRAAKGALSFAAGLSLGLLIAVAAPVALRIAGSIGQAVLFRSDGPGPSVPDLAPAPLAVSPTWTTASDPPEMITASPPVRIIPPYLLVRPKRPQQALARQFGASDASLGIARAPTLVASPSPLRTAPSIGSGPEAVATPPAAQDSLARTVAASRVTPIAAPPLPADRLTLAPSFERDIVPPVTLVSLSVPPAAALPAIDASRPVRPVVESRLASGPPPAPSPDFAALGPMPEPASAVETARAPLLLGPGREQPFGDVQVHLHAPASVETGALRAVAGEIGARFDIAATVRVNFRVSRTQVRHFYAEDAEAAAMLAEIIGAQSRDFTGYRPLPPRGTIEVWMQGGPRSSGGATQRSAPTQDDAAARREAARIRQLRASGHLGPGDL